MPAKANGRLNDRFPASVKMSHKYLKFVSYYYDHDYYVSSAYSLRGDVYIPVS